MPQDGPEPASTAAPSITIAASPLESRRFGVAVGRLALGPDDELPLHRLAAAIEPFDVVVVRCADAEPYLARRFEGIDGFRSIHADTLLYWDGPTASTASTDRGERGDTADLRFEDVGGERLTAIVTRVFQGYRNHYSANPLLDGARTAEVYGEWALTLVAGGATAIVAVTPSGDDVGVSVVDWVAEPPDIKLAGVVESARGGGVYEPLLRRTCAIASERGQDTITISTQSSNVRVMRVWARIGWRPTRHVDTVHLVAERALRTRP